MIISMAMFLFFIDPSVSRILLLLSDTHPKFSYFWRIFGKFFPRRKLDCGQVNIVIELCVEGSGGLIRRYLLRNRSRIGNPKFFLNR
jgi:hypothetical protein